MWLIERNIMEKFTGKQSNFQAELSNNTIFLGSGGWGGLDLTIFGKDVHDFRIWLDSVDNLLNRKVSGDDWLPEDIYKGDNIK